MWHVGLSCDGWRMPIQSNSQFVAHCVCSPVFPLFFLFSFLPASPHPHPFFLVYSAFSASARALLSVGDLIFRQCRNSENLHCHPGVGVFAEADAVETYRSQVAVEGRLVSAFFPKNLKNSLKFDDL
ncbi:MAG: hypothetical protein II893_03200 [Methanomicrobium sp.]|nr:hypothetical protein [Methanomicrobium sp.]